jgi:hypothetical protein
VTLTTTLLQDHACDLAVAFDIRLILDKRLRPEEALALPHLRVVIATTITEETTYAVVLHEFGHLVAALGAVRTPRDPRNANLMRVEEDAAWAWARHYALDWTPTMEAVATYARSTYDDAVATQTAPPAAPVAPRPSIDWSKWK